LLTFYIRFYQDNEGKFMITDFRLFSAVMSLLFFAILSACGDNKKDDGGKGEAPNRGPMFKLDDFKAPTNAPLVAMERGEAREIMEEISKEACLSDCRPNMPVGPDSLMRQDNMQLGSSTVTKQNRRCSAPSVDSTAYDADKNQLTLSLNVSCERTHSSGQEIQITEQTYQVLGCGKRSLSSFADYPASQLLAQSGGLCGVEDGLEFLTHRKTIESVTVEDQRLSVTSRVAMMATDNSPCLYDVDMEKATIAIDDCGQFVSVTKTFEERQQRQDAMYLLVAVKFDELFGYLKEPYYDSGSIKVQVNQWTGEIPLLGGNTTPSWYLQATGEEPLEGRVGGTRW